MAIKHGVVVLTTAPTLIHSVGSAGQHIGINVYNATTATAYVGSSAVTTSEGRPLSPGDTLQMLLWPASGSYSADALYGTSTGTVSIYKLLNRDAT